MARQIPAGAAQGMITMTSATSPHDVNLGTWDDLDSLRAQSTRTLIVATLAGAAAWLSALALRVPKDEPRMWVLPASLAAVGLLCLAVQSRHAQVGRLLFLWGLFGALVLHMHLDAELQSAYYLVLVVLASSAMTGLGSTLVVTLTVSLAITLTAHRWGLWPLPVTYGRAIVLAWIACALAWLSSRNLYLAVAWANQAQAAAQERLEDLRSRRAELRRLSDMLRINQERLHYLNVRLEQAKVAAEEAFRTKQHFVANVSHELRTPLNLITGFAELMAFSPESYGGVRLPRPYQQDMLEIHRSSRHLIGLVEDVLALAQLEAGQMLVRRDWTNLEALLYEVADTMRPLIAAKGLALEMRVESLPTVFADAGRIRQILLNLLNNAYRYTAQGTITIQASYEAREVIVRVRDTGVGIADKDLPLIFQEFYKLGEGTAAQRTDGFGLGLSISRRLAEAHGGRLWAESTPGVGSTFCLTLPTENNPSVSIYPTLVQTTPSTHRARALPVIMTVSEAPDDLLSAYLKDFEVVHATPDRCLEAFEDYQPTALIINDRTSGNGPPEVVTPILDRAPATPVIVCRLPTRASAAQTLRAEALLVKPIARGELLGAIERLATDAPIRSILVVDDDDAMLRMLCRMLTAVDGNRYRVTEACGGAEAIVALQESLPDLLLLDIGMPQVSGYDVLTWLRSQTRGAATRVVFMTGLHLGADAARVYDISLHQASGFGLPKALQIVAGMIEQSLPRAPAEE